jgi:hypothetical protein
VCDRVNIDDGERSEATAHLLQKVQSAQATQGDPI